MSTATVTALSPMSVTRCPHPTGKSCMTILTMARYEWFEEWAGGRPRHRGPDYERYKMEIAGRLLERALLRFPHLRDKVIHGAGVSQKGLGVSCDTA